MLETITGCAERRRSVAILARATCLFITLRRRQGKTKRMPESCAAWDCKNRRSVQTRSLGITFHKFPKEKELRRQWEEAVRRDVFFTSKHAVLCSEHFRPQDFDSTGQTVRLRDGVKPCVVSFPTHLQRPVATRTTHAPRSAEESLSVDCTLCLQDPEPLANIPVAAMTAQAGRRAEESLSVDFSLHLQEPEPLPNVDHSYALPASPTCLKARLSEASAQVESLGRQMRNLKQRERRAKRMVHGLLVKLRGRIPAHCLVEVERNLFRRKCRKTHTR